MQTGSSGCQYNWLTIVLLLGLVLCYSQQCSATAAALPSSPGQPSTSESAANESAVTARKRCPAVAICRQATVHVRAKRSCHR